MPHSFGWHFDNSYSRLPEHFFARQNPVPVRAPRMVVLNHALALELALKDDVLDSAAGAEVFAGNSVPPGAEPIAQAYAGHQFGHLNMLGDGRAILLGEHVTKCGARFDIQLKGSGQTPFSRNGDGRAALGPMLREYIISEAMHFFGIPTTRSLAVVATGEEIFREEKLPGAVLTRVARSHIRVGTFVYAAKVDEQEGTNALRVLADYTIARHFPQVVGTPEPHLGFLRAVIDRQASLIASWMNVGFIHGVMNTDNMALSGETIDYGPCAFMDQYTPETVFSSIDRRGRYAYGNQPKIGAWNLARFAETLLPLFSSDSAKAIAIADEALGAFPAIFEKYFLAGMRNKLGLFSAEPEDAALFSSLFDVLENAEADFTNTFRGLATDKPLPLRELPEFQNWQLRWEARLKRQIQPKAESQRLMQSVNPAIIPRNHKVEEALSAAQAGDLSKMRLLLAALEDPFSDSPLHEPFKEPAPNGGLGYHTFCGT